jgi:23S rRNA (uracil1939-C5)-methyltransferase
MARKKRREPETAAITSVAHDGRGIAATEGKKVFVAGALEGETVTFMRRKFRRNFDEAELLEVHEASPDRIDAKCEAFDRCGGCSLQHISPEHQRDIKAQTLRDNLERIGRVEPGVGFRERHAPFIADMHRCEVLAKPLDSMVADLSELVSGLSIRARLPQIEVAVAENDIALVFRVLDPLTEADEALFRSFGERHELRIYLQTGGLDSVALFYPESVDEPLYYTLPEFKIQIEFEPIDFVQVNSNINQRMVHFAVEQLAVGPADRVLDLFCGIGNFSLPLARKAGAVLGIEGEKTLVERATDNARRNGLDNVTFRVADLSKIDGTESWVRQGWDRLLLDPARSGAAEVVTRMHLFNPERIVYVSCHPGTLARDAGTLVHEQGYRLDSAGIIDMFPHTAHVESIAVFTKS